MTSFVGVPEGCGQTIKDAIEVIETLGGNVHAEYCSHDDDEFCPYACASLLADLRTLLDAVGGHLPPTRKPLATE